MRTLAEKIKLYKFALRFTGTKCWPASRECSRLRVPELFFEIGRFGECGAHVPGRRAHARPAELVGAMYEWYTYDECGWSRFRMKRWEAKF